MTLFEALGLALGGGGAVTGVAAWLRAKAQSGARVAVAKLAAEGSEAERWRAELREVKKECADERKKAEKAAKEDREECAESIGALQSMLFRSMGVGEDTGRFMLEDERANYRQRSLSLPPVKK